MEVDILAKAKKYKITLNMLSENIIINIIPVGEYIIIRRPTLSKKCRVIIKNIPKGLTINNSIESSNDHRPLQQIITFNIIHMMGIIIMCTI